MTDLNGLPIPDHFNGIGLHDTPSSVLANWGYAEATDHARILRQHGVTVYKILADNANKVDRCRAYVDHGIVPIVRPYIPEPWGSGLQMTPSDILRQYVDVGARVIELGNEFNIECEWKDGNIPGAAAIAQEVCNWWEKCLQRASEAPGMIPLFPSNTPGGNVDHRRCYQEIVAELVRRGLQSSVKHIAIHPRPHNNPPDTTWTPSNTCAFDEWRWIRDQFEAAGIYAYYWATEHGYSLGDDQNHDYPRIDLQKWTEYSAELLLRLNPAHAKAIEPELAGLMHWYEAGWGHWGSWAKDAIVDSPAPEMPAPSPLWTWMGETPLEFSRYGDTPPPPPPPPPPDEQPWCVDISYAQPSFDFGVFEGQFAIIRQGIGRTLDSHVFRHDNKSKSLKVRIGYHYLKEDNNGSRQGRFAAALHGHLGWKTPFAVDVEEVGLKESTIRDFVNRWYDLKPDTRLLIYTSPGFWAQFGHRLDDVAAKCDLWIAHWDVPKPTIPNGWTTYRVWQKGKRLVDGWARPVDYNVFNGSLEDLYQWALGEIPPTPPTPPGPTPPYSFEVSYHQGMALIIGDYPVPGVSLTRTDPWGNEVTVTTGHKPEYGPGGFEIWATPEGAMFSLTVEGHEYPVPTMRGHVTVAAWY
jgi:hypothetical protein